MTEARHRSWTDVTVRNQNTGIYPMEQPSTSNDIARPMTVAEAAKVLLDASYADPVGYSELLAEQPLGGIDGLQRSLRAMSQGGE